MSSESKVGGLPAKWRAEARRSHVSAMRAQRRGDTEAMYANFAAESDAMAYADELEAALSAHGQPVVDEAMVERALSAIWMPPFSPETRELMRAALAAALTGADHE